MWMRRILPNSLWNSVHVVFCVDVLLGVRRVDLSQDQDELSQTEFKS